MDTPKAADVKLAKGSADVQPVKDSADAKPVKGSADADRSPGDTKDFKGPKEPEAVGGKAMVAFDAETMGKPGSGITNDSEDEDAVCEALHRELKLSADAESEMKKVLILLDFNGTLVYRDKDSSIRNLKADYRVGHSQYFIRPFARELVCHLINDPRCKVCNHSTTIQYSLLATHSSFVKVAIYTSIMAKNMRPVLDAFDDHYERMGSTGR
jgi:hypothetical protein